MIIAVDGPSAAGKGTLARAIAKKLGYHFLDTGSIYRMVGLEMIRARKDRADSAAAITIAKALDPSRFADSELRTEEVAAMASLVAAIPEVRLALLDFQRGFAKRPPGAVLDGRDIGTVVCPEADLKFFVTASAEVRAQRRFEELKALGDPQPYEQVLLDIRARDERDANRAHAPTKPAADAVLLDTSTLTAEEAFAAAQSVIRTRL